MRKAKVIFIAAVLLALSAVGVVAFVATHSPQPPVAAAPEHTWLTDELNLTPPQRDQIKAIWTGTMQSVMQKLGERRKTLRDERDAAIMEMLSPEQKTEYEQILQQYAVGLKEIDQKRDTLFHDATEQTKSILNPEQVKKYLAILAERSQHGGGHRPQGASRHGPGSGPGSGPGPVPGSDMGPERHEPRGPGPGSLGLGSEL